MMIARLLSRGIDVRTAESVTELDRSDKRYARWWALHDTVMPAIDPRRAKGGIFAVCGAPGCGKTMLGAAAIMAFIDARLTGKKVGAAAMFRQLLEAMHAHKEDQAMQHLCSAMRLLVIDEFHDRAGSPYEDRRIREIIDKRWGNNLPLLMLTNLKADAFAEAVGGAAVDRIRSAGEIIECGWGSFR